MHVTQNTINNVVIKGHRKHAIATLITVNIMYVAPYPFASLVWSI